MESMIGTRCRQPSATSGPRTPSRDGVIVLDATRCVTLSRVIFPAPCRRRSMTLPLVRFIALTCAVVLCSCTPQTYVPELATRPYPVAHHTTTIVDIQCFRRGTELEIVNATAQSYANFDLWINQRYVHSIESLPAGATIRLSLWDFVDEYGHRMYAGGFFRSYPADPVRLVEIQAAADQPMVGLVAIRSETIRTVTRQ